VHLDWVIGTVYAGEASPRQTEGCWVLHAKYILVKYSLKQNHELLYTAACI